MPSDPINIGSDSQLFIDDHIVSSVVNVRRQFHRPIRYEGNPIIQADMPWEQGGNGVYLYGGTVMFDEEEQIFKMWYRTASVERDHQSDEATGAYKACYATSEDGVRWNRIPLGLVDYRGSKTNNMLPPAMGTREHIRRPNLIKDYMDKDPERRYKIAYMDNFEGRWGLAKGYSADGIHWTMNVGNPSFFDKPVAPNGILFGWDPNFQKFVHFHRLSKSVRVDVDGRTTRHRVATVRSTSTDFELWEDTKEIIRSSDTDPPNWSPAHGVDLAAINYTKDLYVGFIDTCTTHAVEDVPPSLWEEVYRSEYANYQTEVLISRDGNQWTRVAPHWEFMRPGLWGTWDRSLIGLSKPIVVKDEILFYYTGSNLPGAAADLEHPQHHLVHQVVDGQRQGFAIGLAKMRRDGFVSMDGYEPTGVLTTKLIVFSGDRLILNTRTPHEPFGAQSSRSTPFGQMKVEILHPDYKPVQGYSVAESDVFTGDSVRHTATWCGNQDTASLQDRPIRLRFHLQNSALYSFQFRGDTDPLPQFNLLAPGARGRPLQQKFLER